MISVPIVDVTGKQVGTYSLDPADFAKAINKQLLHDVVVMYQANKRIGSHKTKTRGEVAGSTKKLFRQKGTGNARVGTKRSPIRRGGGHAFAKVPRDYGYRLPKKAIRAATRMAVLSKFQDGQAVILDQLAVTEIKTKAVAQVLKALGLKEDSTLLAIKDYDNTLYRSARNIGNLMISPARELNALDVLRQRRFLVTKDALDVLKSAGKEKAAQAG
ncbi:50S ribosomal protein L4 [Caulifigura coniformis]|uniref:Large ribosomal subunit protein uL4 n=1 Tax=Caulifigura coniformis TaxID=2527983 RepID=A0A517SE69_9PLAN|nr:50S ribosomal protein L4 [Caulifigura coniformis]QDT54408.1 50S ribosomal protein L4 [Caulifigura coniformis]